MPTTPQRPREAAPARFSSSSTSSLFDRMRRTSLVHHSRNRSDLPSTTPSTGYRTRSPLRSTPPTPAPRRISFDLNADGLEINGVAQRTKGPVVTNTTVKREKQVESPLHKAGKTHSLRFLHIQDTNASRASRRLSRNNRDISRR